MRRGPASRLIRTGVGLAAVLWAGGPSSVFDGRPNLLLITLDTTRADRLGCYGHREAATPRLDRIASEGALLEHAEAVAPLTLPSHASILTSLYPPRHGVRDNGDFRLPGVEVTLAEHLGRQGYSTGAAVGSIVLAATQGLDQGFDEYDEPRAGTGVSAMGAGIHYQPMLERRAAEVTDAASGLLGRLRGEPFFLWVHYFDPHGAYEPPPAYRKRFEGRLYDGEIAYMDSEIGRLLDDLGRRGSLGRTLVAVVGDHGEALGEHGESTHGLLLYEATLRVPLLLRFPGKVPAGARIPEVVSGVDLAPTLLDLMGLPPMGSAQGRSFASALRGAKQPDPTTVYAEAILPERVFGWAPVFALREGDVKFIEAPEPEIYDLEKDPRELTNLAAARPADVRRWRSRLESKVRAFGRGDSSAEHEADGERRARLESLGYVFSGAKTARKDPPDPKRFVAQSEGFLEAKALVAQGRLEQAHARLGAILVVDPDNPAARSLDGTVLFSLGRREEGLVRLDAAARSAPGVYEHQRNLANASHVLGRLEQAEQAYRAALGIQPFAAESHYGLGNVLFALGDSPGAEKSYREAIRLGLDTAPVLTALGTVMEKAGRPSEARRAYEAALAAQPKDPDALFHHAKICLRQNEAQAARRSAEALLVEQPRHPAGRCLLGQILLAIGDRQGARKILREFLSQPNADPKLVPAARQMLEQTE